MFGQKSRERKTRKTTCTHHKHKLVHCRLFRVYVPLAIRFCLLSRGCVAGIAFPNFYSFVLRQLLLTWWAKNADVFWHFEIIFTLYYLFSTLIAQTEAGINNWNKLWTMERNVKIETLNLHINCYMGCQLHLSDTPHDISLFKKIRLSYKNSALFSIKLI